MPTDIPLHPDVRNLYGAILRPPPGTIFDSGVATSFSLDFETALAVPVTLALFASESRDELLTSPLALLEGLERTSDRLAIFCEAGRIQAQSKPQSRLCALLERMILEVTAPRGGAFHPKIWVLRYRPLDAGEPHKLRLIVLSRNLTRDRSWDLSLALDGAVGRGRKPVNKPLVEFVKRLPTLSTMPPSDHIAPLIAEMVDDLERADWVLPPGFENLSFAVNGVGRRVWKPEPCSKMAVISPFCDENALELLADLTQRGSPKLVSRSEELAAIPETTLERFAEILVMDEVAESEDGEGDDADETDARPLSGLHAKAFIQESGWDTTVTVGSGNATRPALINGRNVEVFATLTGRRARVGSIDEILGSEGFGRVLRPFQRGEIPPPDSEQVTAEKRVEEARRTLADAGLNLSCAREASVEQNSSTDWRLSIRLAQPLRLEGLSAAKVWPITRGEDHARDILGMLQKGGATDIGVLPIADITRFLGFRLVDESGKAEAIFTLGVVIDGLPDNRHQAILRKMIDSRETFLQYLRLLLADLNDPFSAQLAWSGANGAKYWGDAFDDEPILEDMVRALSHGRDRLKAVQRLMERLERPHTGDDPDIIPSDFIELWSAFQTVLGERGALDD
tara:strand:- start:3110 stop:4984 length:1875 start_codon:yes stop_codon:yes gene_type:complete